ncbi:MAG: hypothetical protein GY758_33985 [Fuerstiella sp.]|nr:hypothetical protein [Fuerstiella sp.]MCP4786761.1 hypothetical protein [Fuerstiella sp.]
MSRSVFIGSLFLLAPFAGAQPSVPAPTDIVIPANDESVRVIDPAEFGQLTDTNRFAPVPREQLSELLRLRHELSLQPEPASPVRKAELSATLEGNTLRHGRIQLQLYHPPSASQQRTPLKLTTTNLQNLTLRSAGHPVVIASDYMGNLAVLNNTKDVLDGNWTAHGRMIGEDLVFQLVLPTASVCQFTLTTNPEIHVTSPDALVMPKTVQQGMNVWELHPRFPGALTIKCSRDKSPDGKETVAIDAVASIRTGANTADAEWIITLPSSLSNAVVVLGLDASCTVTQVDLSTGRPLQFESQVRSERTELRIQMATLAATSTIRIQGRFVTGMDTDVRLPILSPKAWIADSTTNDLALKSSSVRISVPSEVDVQSLSLNGLQERDVAYQADGSQRLDLAQFSKQASGSIRLSVSRAVVTDAMFMRADSTAKEATAYIHVKVISGFLSEVTWTMPASWRVTGVHEADSDRPLLFQMTDDKASPAQSRITAYLRTPLTPLPPNSQTLIVSLQSTGSVFSRQWLTPRLQNPDYNRGPELQSTTAGTVDPAAINAGTTSLTVDDVATLLPWLPTDVLESIVNARQMDSAVNSPPTLRSTMGPMSATIDYTVAMEQDSVRETHRVRLKSTDPLPKRIPLQVTPGVELQISDESVTQPVPTLTRQNAGGTDEVVLEIPAGVDTTHTLDILLVSMRPLAAEMPAVLISFPTADQVVGSLQPPHVESNLALSVIQDDVTADIGEPIPYPTTPFASTMTIRNLAQRSPGQEVSGLAMALVSRKGNHFSVEIAHRLLVRSVGNRSDLVIQHSMPGLFVVFVDGQPAFPDRSNDRYKIALPTDREHAVVDVYVVCELPDIQNGDDLLRLPMLAFPDADSDGVTCSVLPSRQHALTLADSPPGRDPRSAEFISRTLTHHYSQQTNSELSDRFRPMLTRCQLRMSGADSVIVLNSRHNLNPVAVHIEETEFHFPQTIVLASVAFLIWLAAGRMVRVPFRLIGTVLLIFLAAYHLEGFRSVIILNGLSIGTLCFAAVAVGRRLSERLLHRPLTAPPDSQIRSSAAVVLLCLTLASSDATADEAREQILIPTQKDKAFPYVYVDRELLSRLNSVKSQLSTTAYVIQTDLRIEVEAADSVTSTVQCLVASPPHSTSQLNIPFNGVTLVDCSLDGTRVFPSVEQPDNGQVEIPQRSLLPPAPLGSPSTSPSAQGRDTLSGWDLRTIRYSVRCTRELLTATNFRISVPHSRSPVTRVSLSDPLRLVSEATHEDVSGSVTQGVEDHLFTFPAAYNSERTVVSVALRSAAETSVNVSQSTSVVCAADISPTQLRLSCHYSVVKNAGQSTTVDLGIAQNYQITRVESLTGEELPWSINGDELTVVVAASDEGLQRFVVQQVQESTISLHHSIPIGAITTVNGRPADDVIIAAGTPDEFLISTIRSPNAELHEPEQNRQQQIAEHLRNSQWIVSVPGMIARVDIEIEGRTTAREAELAQEVVVSDARLDWTAQCRIQVLGNPTFRQTFIVSPDVRIKHVSASVGATARLQSWTRDKESVVVSFREATRGMVVVDFTGDVLRKPGQPTTLPVFALPDSVATLKSTLVMSSNAASETFIKDLQSAVPLTRIDISRYVLSETPLQTTLTDDSRPPVIRPSEDRILHAEIVAVLHSVAGKTQVTEFISLKPQHSQFDIHCRPPAEMQADSLTVTVDGQPSPLTIEGDGVVITRQTTAARTVLIVPDVLAPAREGLLTAALPVFEADLKITSCEVFDARGQRSAGAGPEIVPPWVIEASDAHGLLSIPKELHKPRCDAAEPENLIRVYLSEQQRTSLPVNPASGVAYAHALHDVQLDDITTIGRSEFLVFATRPNATVELKIPVQTRVVDVQHNGAPVPFSVTDNTIHLHGTAQVGRFEVQWRCQSQAAMFQHEFLLPSVAAPQQHSLVRLAAAEETLWWATNNETEVLQQWYADSQASVAQGFLLIEQPTPVLDSTVPEKLPPIIAEPEWHQLAVASRDAAESLLHTSFSHSPSTDYRYLSTRIRQEVAVTLVTTPATISLMTGLVGIVLFAVSPRRRRRNAGTEQRQPEEESSLAV